MAKGYRRLKWMTYGVGFATIVESIVLIVMLNSTLNNIVSASVGSESQLPEYYHGAISNINLVLVMFFIRMFFGLLLIIGQTCAIIQIKLVFFIYILLGDVANLMVAVAISGNPLTRGYEIAITCLTGLHAVYFAMIWYVLTLEFKKDAAAAQEQVSHVSVQTTVSVGSNPQCEGSFNSNTAANIQVYPAGTDDPNIQNESTGYAHPPPPKYSEIDQSADCATKQDSKPVN